jgi:hypothetical protein
MQFKPLILASPILFFLALSSAAMGQTAQTQAQEPSTRAGVLEAARVERTGDVTPPARSSTERALYWYDNQYVLAKLFGGWKGIHLAGGDFPAGAGMKFGVGFDKALTSSDPDPNLPNRVDLTARAAYSTRGYARVSTGVNLRNIGGAPVDISVLGQFYEFPQEDFFGIGRDSLDSDRSNYLLDSSEAGLAVRWRPWKVLDFGAGGWYLAPRIGQGTDSRFPSTEQTFDTSTIPGYTEQPDFLRADLAAAFDWRDNPAHPHGGGRYGVTVSQFRDQDFNKYDFQRVEVNLQQYVPLATRYRILALRAEAVMTDADAGQQVPFYFQPTLGGARSLRGFREFRFRDQNSLLLGAEYRWEAWWALDGALFVDAGTVAPTRRDLSVRDMDVTYGVGFRFHSNSAVVGRLDLAFSKEGFVPLLRFEHVF